MFFDYEALGKDRSAKTSFILSDAKSVWTDSRFPPGRLTPLPRAVARLSRRFSFASFPQEDKTASLSLCVSRETYLHKEFVTSVRGEFTSQNLGRIVPREPRRPLFCRWINGYQTASKRAGASFERNQAPDKSEQILLSCLFDSEINKRVLHSTAEMPEESGVRVCL